MIVNTLKIVPYLWVRTSPAISGQRVVILFPRLNIVLVSINFRFRILDSLKGLRHGHGFNPP